MQILGNRVLVEPIAVLKSSGGIHYAPSFGTDANIGGVKLYRVLGVGPGRRSKKGVVIPVETTPGDRVLCHSYTTGPVPLDDGKMLITDDQILAVLPKPTS